MEGLDWQPLHIPLAAGLQQRMDDRARPAQALDIAKDIQFDEIGGIQTRKPFALLPTAILGGGALANVRRPVDNGDELLCFTKDTLYSYADGLQKWIARGTHLAITTEERTVSAAPLDAAGADRAELGGVIVTVWESAGLMYIEAEDSTTHAVILAAQPFNVGQQPRVVALANTFLVTYVSLALVETRAIAIFPADVAGSIVGPSATVTVLHGMYDVERVPGLDRAIVAAQGGANYDVVVLAPPAVIGNPVTISTSATKVRRADGPIAVTCTPDGAKALVVRTDETAGNHDIIGDIVTVATLADTAFINLAIGDAPAGATTKPQQIAAAFRSVQVGGQYRAHVFWHYGETPINPAITLRPTIETNTVDANGALGAESTFALALGLASRAFDCDGRVFVNTSFAQPTELRPAGGTTVFGPALQNTVFLYRDDRLLVAKIAPNRSNGHPVRRGVLPGVQLIAANQYAWCMTERRIIPMDSDRFVFATSKSTAARFSDPGPREVVITFDDDDARRCVRLGETLYITGGLIVAYDGQSLVEVGWQVMPYGATLTETGIGAIEAGTYAYRPSAFARNNRGEVDRSSTALIGERGVIGAPPNGITTTVLGPSVTRRTLVALELWRTEKDPTADALFQLVTSPDPADAVAGANKYLVYDPLAGVSVTLDDQLVDSDITARPAHPVTGATLEYIAPPAAKVILGMEDRIILGDVAGDPDRLWYSRQRLDGEVASFHGNLVVEVPPVGGRITALAALPNTRTLIAFRETAVYALEGTGFDNTLGGSNYGPARQLAPDVGALSQESVVVTPLGVLFQSHKGWQLLDLQGVAYVGAPVSDYDSEPVLAAQLLEAQHQVRILTGSRMLVWDYLAKQWAEWTIVGGLGACLWNGAHLYLSAAGLAQQQTTYVGVNYGIDVETPWIKPSDLQGYARVRKMLALGEFRSAHRLRIRIAYNYDPTYVDDRYWTVSPTIVGGPLQLKIGPKRQQVQSIKIRLTAYDAVLAAPPSGEALKLTGLALEVGFKRGLYSRLPAAQRS